MSNDYFNGESQIARHTKAKSGFINSLIATLAAAFDLLPGKDKLLQNRVTHYADTGTANTCVVTMSPPITSYVDGLKLRLIVAATNTGACTLNVNGIGARAIKIFDNTDPVAGDLTAGDVIEVVYQSSRTAFILLSQARGFVVSAQTAAETAVQAKEDAVTAKEGSETAYTNFQKYMLGPKDEDPETDNQGDDLLVGAVYWKNNSGFRVWDGDNWDDAVFDLNISISDVSELQAALDGTAPLESPALTGAPTAPTADPEDSSGQIANTEFVANALTEQGALIAEDNLSDLGNVQEAVGNLGLNYSMVSATATATKFQSVAADVSGGAWTLSLPASPSAGDWVRVVVVSGDPEVNALTVSGNGKNINGDASLTVDVIRATVTLIYNGTEWRIS